MKCDAVYQNKNSHPQWRDQSTHQIVPVRVTECLCQWCYLSLMDTRKSFGVDENSSKFAMSSCFTWIGSQSSITNLHWEIERGNKGENLSAQINISTCILMLPNRLIASNTHMDIFTNFYPQLIVLTALLFVSSTVQYAKTILIIVQKWQIWEYHTFLCLFCGQKLCFFVLILKTEIDFYLFCILLFYSWPI